MAVSSPPALRLRRIDWQLTTLEAKGLCNKAWRCWAYVMLVFKNLQRLCCVAGMYINAVTI